MLSEGDDKSYEVISSLLNQSGFSGEIIRIGQLAAGGNNKTYLVETEKNQFVAKQYFQHVTDERNRLQSEYDFLIYADKVAPLFVPKALYKDIDAGMALYEYLSGKPVAAGEVMQQEVDAAIDFFIALNDRDSRSRADNINKASESVFSFGEHLQIVDKRLNQLSKIEVKDEIDVLGKDFIDHLAAYWMKFRDHLLARAESTGWDISISLPETELCISPSDFGFHNAVRTTTGELRFIDFEYAGWDDPAKTIADFFSQPAVPVPEKYFDHFVTSVSGLFSENDLALRTRMLLPVHQIKWCCIAMNVFLPIHLERRKFANPGLDEEVIKAEQLQKAVAKFKMIKESKHAVH